MRNLIVLVTLVLVALLPFATKEHDSRVPTGIRIIKDLPYVPGSTDERQMLDLFIPKARYGKSLPLIVWIHGGGWIEGDKSASPAIELARKGFASASINYRLAPKHRFPAQIFDCKAAVRWLRANAGEYGFDPDRIGVWGHSAGGHLAALIGTTNDIKEMEGDLGNGEQSSSVKAVCDWSGPTDLLTFKEQCPPDVAIGDVAPPEMVDMLLGGPPEEKQELARQASPVLWASRKSPPFLIMHSEGDPIVPYVQSQELANKLESVGADVTLVKLRGDNHAFFRKDTFEKVLDFFGEKLAGKSAAVSFQPRGARADQLLSRVSSTSLAPLTPAPAALASHVLAASGSESTPRPCR